MGISQPPLQDMSPFTLVALVVVAGAAILPSAEAACQRICAEYEWQCSDVTRCDNDGNCVGRKRKKTTSLRELVHGQRVKRACGEVCKRWETKCTAPTCSVDSSGRKTCVGK